MTTTSILALIGLVVGPVGAYLLAARKMSGKIKTTEADQLWSESRGIREYLSEQLNATALRAGATEVRVAHLEKDNNSLTLENERLKSRVETLQGLVDTLRKTITDLQEAIRKKDEQLEAKK